MNLQISKEKQNAIPLDEIMQLDIEINDNKDWIVLGDGFGIDMILAVVVIQPGMDPPSLKEYWFRKFN
jgi:hypothetical protein